TRDRSANGRRKDAMMMISEESRGRSGVMNHRVLFSLCCIFSLILPSLASFDISANVTIHQDELGRHFILIDEGENIELSCEAFEENHYWVLPDNSDVRDFSKADQEARVKTFSGHDVAEQKLTISKAKVTDTGLYGCKHELNVETDVYVFVRGSQFFLKQAVHGYQVEEEFTVPCRSSWPPLDEEGIVELYAEGELWKEASKHYDPRIGFEMKAKLMSGKKLDNGIRFECKYNSESISYLMTNKPIIDEDDYEFSFQEETEFPYVGGSYQYSCLLDGKDVFNNRMLHRINTDCPRCKDRTDMHFKQIHHNADEIRNQTTIDKLTALDSGKYTCQWYMEKDESFVLMKEATKMLIVSSKMEQIKLVNSTEPRADPNGRAGKFIEIDEGRPLSLFAVFRTFPAPQYPIYSSKWMRHYTRAEKKGNETEGIITDSTTTTTLTDFKGNEAFETLTIAKATPNMSGTYVVEAELPNNVTQSAIWTIRVKAKTIVPYIKIASQGQWVLFDQDYYNAKAELRVICYVESFPKAEVHLKTRRLNPDTEWEGVEGAVAIEGTYSKGYALNVTATNDVEYKCEGRRNGESVFESKKVLVSDSVAGINVTFHKPEQATESEGKEDMYEGDKVELECIVPKADQVSMEWLFENAKANLAEMTTVTAHSKHLIATIEAATSTNSGKYSCVIKDDKNHTRIETRIIEVQKATKPFLRGASIDPNVVIKYGEQLDLTCSMDGTPVPQHKWLKDGVEMTDPSFFSINGQKLHFPRAAAQDEGTYTCQAANRAGTTTVEYKLKVKGAPKTLSGVSIFFIVLAFLVLIGCLIAAFVLYMRQKKRSKEQQRSLAVLYEQLMRGPESDAPLLPTHGKVTMDMRVRRTAYDPKYEIDMKNLVLLESLGAGQFGSVRKGRLARGAPVSDTAAYRGPALTVAIKSPRNGSNPEDQKALIDELKILIAIDNLEETKHPNVLSLVGAVTRNMKDGQLFVVFEMCENGDLKTFLQKYKTDLKGKFLNELKENKEPTVTNDDYLVPIKQFTVQYASQGDPDWHADQERDRLLGDPQTLSTSDLISFSMQIASGMDFLAGVNCIHRDLAARNCLLNANKVVKIADFGMAKNEDKGYYRMKKTNVMVPYRWMAPESMEDHTFTVESDIWSYGIVLYEIFTLGSQPYPGVPNNNLHEHLKSGQRNPRPELCHPDIYNLMVQTWEKDAERRPTFGQCANFMREQLQLVNPEILESADAEITRNAAQIAQFDQFRGPRATAILDEQELAALFAGQRTPVSNGAGDDEEETGERIYIKELRR
ncbi:hypothetical protein PENTCL1PPCAC_29907, partial [Pristionchus entomophagus]